MKQSHTPHPNRRVNLGLLTLNEFVAAASLICIRVPGSSFDCSAIYPHDSLSSKCHNITSKNASTAFRLIISSLL